MKHDVLDVFLGGFFLQSSHESRTYGWIEWQCETDTTALIGCFDGNGNNEEGLLSLGADNGSHNSIIHDGYA